ncbi:hypothetical protein [Pseudomonas sp. PE-S1G-1]|uniref:hypothetical protein n=1 Tax=Pseudomonas sp. PE-S1G-1 TaxID=1986995 RepID=UPI000B4048A6|nr:hypothetical protein [Pseudomonas sp. PE-S1G-1]
MANRQKYTVLIPFPTGGGHWSTVGQELDLLDVQAQQLEVVGRIKLTAQIAAEAAAAAPAETAAPAAKKSTAKAD